MLPRPWPYETFTRQFHLVVSLVRASECENMSPDKASILREYAAAKETAQLARRPAQNHVGIR